VDSIGMNIERRVTSAHNKAASREQGRRFVFSLAQSVAAVRSHWYWQPSLSEGKEATPSEQSCLFAFRLHRDATTLGLHWHSHFYRYKAQRATPPTRDCRFVIPLTQPLATLKDCSSGSRVVQKSRGNPAGTRLPLRGSAGSTGAYHQVVL